jgi:hypothetical protein
MVAMTLRQAQALRAQRPTDLGQACFRAAKSALLPRRWPSERNFARFAFGFEQAHVVNLIAYVMRVYTYIRRR